MNTKESFRFFLEKLIKEGYDILATYLFKKYLDYINNNMFDLMGIFKSDYMDYRFHGSASIKKVLPVVCPHFFYQDLEAQDGTMALGT